MTCFSFAFKYLTSSTFLGKIGKYIKPCVGEGLCGTFARAYSYIKQSSTVIANHYSSVFLFHQVPITADWTEAT